MTSPSDGEIILSSTNESDRSTSENDQDLRSFLSSLTAHLMPELSTTFDEETEDEQSSMSEIISSEEPTLQEDQIVDSIVQRSIDDAKGELMQFYDAILSDQIQTVDISQ